MLEKNPEAKFLLICRSQVKVLALEEALRTRSGVKLARFHEGMSIVQRDRNAAFFAEADGARLLLCAEIGSEGRNFQFAQHLILWDLPLDPDLLEQRIGRLDRIGQRAEIRIHVAAFSGSAQQVLVRWYDAGLDAFRSSPADGRELYKRFGEPLIRLALEHAHGGEDLDAEIDVLIAETRAAHEELSALIHRGRDRLLELANQREGREQNLAQHLIAADADRHADDFVLRLFEQFGVESDDQGRRAYLLDPEYLSTDGFPGLKDGPQLITFDRATALVREDLPFLGTGSPDGRGRARPAAARRAGQCRLSGRSRATAANSVGGNGIRARLRRRASLARRTVHATFSTTPHCGLEVEAIDGLATQCRQRRARDRAPGRCDTLSQIPQRPGAAHDQALRGTCACGRGYGNRHRAGCGGARTWRRTRAPERTAQGQQRSAALRKSKH